MKRKWTYLLGDKVEKEMNKRLMEIKSQPANHDQETKKLGESYTSIYIVQTAPSQHFMGFQKFTNPGFPYAP